MERYTNEEFKNAIERFKNFYKQFMIVNEEYYNAVGNNQEYDINSIKDEEVKEVARELIELEENNADDEQIKKAAWKTASKFFDFDRFTHENWITFVKTEELDDLQDSVISMSDDNIQNSILDAMLENDDVFWYWTEFSEKVRNNRFMDVLKAASEESIIRNRVFSYVDEKVILDNANEIMEICEKDKKSLVSSTYHRIGDEIYNRPELIAKTIEILKDTPWIDDPWKDATPEIRREKKDLFPQIVKNRRCLC